MDLFLSDVEDELDGLRRILEVIPEEHFAWRPHPRSWTLAELAGHLVNLLNWQRMILERDGLDLATMPPSLPAPRDRSELLERFEKSLDVLRSVLASITEDSLSRPWTLQHGERVIFSMPRIKAFRRSGINHMVHHRAQLTVYLRLLDIPLPGLYGASADERPAG